MYSESIAPESQPLFYARYMVGKIPIRKILKTLKSAIFLLFKQCNSARSCAEIK